MTQGAPQLAAVVRQRPTIDSIVREVTELSTLPAIATKVMEVARNEKSGAADLTAVVEADPVLSARVLRMVNSASCGIRTTVTNLQQAISYLGFREVRNLALTASVSEMFAANERIGRYYRGDLWRHMVSVGICARMVATRCRILNFDDVFLAGLLHDIGVIIEDQHASDEFQRLMKTLSDKDTLVTQEQKLLGFDHCTLGARVAEVWKFPAGVQSAIRYHHGTDKYQGEHAEIVYCVDVANVICTIKKITSVGLGLLKPSLESFRALGFEKDDIVILATDLDQELAANENLFEQ